MLKNGAKCAPASTSSSTTADAPRDGDAPRQHVLAAHAVFEFLLALEDQDLLPFTRHEPRQCRTGEPPTHDDDVEVHGRWAYLESFQLSAVSGHWSLHNTVTHFHNTVTQCGSRGFANIGRRFASPRELECDTCGLHAT